MKKMVIMGLMVLAVAASSCSANRSTSASNDELKAYVSKVVADKDFKIVVNTAFPIGAQAIPLSSPYSLTIKGDSVNSYLPFFGQAYRVPYIGSVGLNFEGVMTDYNVMKGRNGDTVVKFKLTSPEDRHDYTIEIWNNGVSSIHVYSQNRQSISFEGRLETTNKGE